MRSQLCCHSLASYCIFINLFCLSDMLTAQGIEQKHGSPSVIVQLGRPNVWTMDQAHYLLERNRTLDLQIQQKKLEELDPNSQSGTRLIQTTTSFGASGGYDQSLGTTNQINLGNYRTDRARYEALLTSQAEALNELQKVTLAKTVEEKKLTQLTTAAASQSALDAQKARVELADVRVSGAQAKYDNITKALSAPQVPALTSSSVPDISLPSLDNTAAFYKTAAEASKNLSKLAASQLLENHINLQYEMVAKQLTLLRDQAGPDNAVIFLELPQSLYYTRKAGFPSIMGPTWRKRGGAWMKL